MNFFKFFLILITLSSCTSYLTSSPDRLALTQVLNADVGKPFLRIYPITSEHISKIKETKYTSEYLVNERNSVIFNNCSWYLVVNKESGLIENWKLISSGGCD